MDPTESSNTTPLSGMKLLGVRRFRPYFLTQFLGAFNDNLFRNALIGLLAFQMTTLDGSAFGAASWINVAAGLFILPFFFCSAMAGQLADRLDKAWLMRRVKFAEIPIMFLGGFAIVNADLPLLMLSIGLMGAQSAFFGPAKYGILPLHLHPDELTRGNALVQSGTMLAILLGTISGGLLIQIPDQGGGIAAWAVVSIAVLGWFSARRIPAAPPVAAGLIVNRNVLSSTLSILRAGVSDRPILLAVLGISWFWFVGSIVLMQIPVYVRDSLGGAQPLATALLATFTVGIALGALLCARLSGRRIEIGLLPIGALCMAIFAIRFALVEMPSEIIGADLGTFLGSAAGCSILLNLALLSVATGLYTVPLYAFVQSRAERASLARVIAFNNILNALFMVAASVAAILMILGGLSLPEMILAVATVHVGVVLYIFREVPEAVLRLLAWLIAHALYRIRVDGIENIPEKGPAILVCNHVSYVDPLIIFSRCRRPVRFVMHHRVYRWPLLNLLFRAVKAIPIASGSEDPVLLERAYTQIAETLEAGGIVALFPEGQLTRDGAIAHFKPGIERIVKRTPVPVVPMATRGLWGTFFSRFDGGPALKRWPRHWLAPVFLQVGSPVPPQAADVGTLYRRIQEMARHESDRNASS